jgi:hypothetical protein
MESNVAVGEKRKALEDNKEDVKRQRTQYTPEEIRALMEEVAALKEENAILSQKILLKKTRLKQPNSSLDIDDELKDMLSSESEDELLPSSPPTAPSSRARRVTPTRKPEVCDNIEAFAHSI